jgi:hypothetical protein
MDSTHDLCSFLLKLAVPVLISLMLLCNTTDEVRAASANGASVAVKRRVTRINLIIV